MANLEDEFRNAFRRITRWMHENGAELIAFNLANGADAATLDACEKRIGFPIGAELRALWSVHDGQDEEGNGLYEAYDLLSTKLADPDDVRRFLPFLREECTHADLATSGMTPAELATDAWIRVAGRDSDGFALNTESGRVFQILHDDFPALRYEAPSLLAWLSSYADRVEADDYVVAEGFGDCYLEARDRAAEAREAAREAEEERRLGLSPEEAIDLAIAKNNEQIAQDAYARATNDAAFLELLFAKASPMFVATTLRPMLRDLVLSKPQWEIVLIGAKELGNNALIDLALRMLG